jgi:hypothetical protein
LAVVERWSVVHDKLEHLLDHSLLDEIYRNLEMRLCKLLEEEEKFVKVSPVNSCAIHHAINKEFNES